jgi:hypothetical protein
MAINSSDDYSCDAQRDIPSRAVKEINSFYFCFSFSSDEERMVCISYYETTTMNDRQIPWILQRRKKNSDKRGRESLELFRVHKKVLKESPKEGKDEMKKNEENK